MEQTEHGQSTELPAQSTLQAQKGQELQELSQPEPWTNLTKERTYKKKQRVLAIIKNRRATNITTVCELAKISRQTHYNWLKQDKRYKEAVDDAYESLKDALEEKAYAMALTDSNPQVLLATLRAKAKDRGWGEDNRTLVQTNVQINNERQGAVWEIKRMLQEAAEKEEGAKKKAKPETPRSTDG